MFIIVPLSAPHTQTHIHRHTLWVVSMLLGEGHEMKGWVEVGREAEMAKGQRA